MCPAMGRQGCSHTQSLKRQEDPEGCDAETHRGSAEPFRPSAPKTLPLPSCQPSLGGCSVHLLPSGSLSLLCTKGRHLHCDPPVTPRQHTVGESAHNSTCWPGEMGTKCTRSLVTPGPRPWSSCEDEQGAQEAPLVQCPGLIGLPALSTLLCS